MATAVTRGIRRIEADRKWEDYESLKQYCSSYHKKGTNEIIFDGFQTMTNAAAALEPSDQTIAFPGAALIPFVSTLADDANQDKKDLWVIYQSDDGVIQDTVLHIINDDASTAATAPLGNEDVFDTVAAGQGGKAITLTAINDAVGNTYAGWYMVTRSGDGVGEAANLIVSNSLASPTILTVTNNSHAAANADIVQLQQVICEDFFRCRQMYCEIECLDDKPMLLENAGATAVYATISKGMRYNSSPNYFSTDAAYARCFLGKIVASASWESTDAKAQGNEIQVTFTPKAQNSDAAASDVIIDLVFQDKLDWQPCIELEPATDVTIKILALDNTNVDDLYIQVHYLEARQA